jgi:hypothetical protein
VTAGCTEPAEEPPAPGADAAVASYLAPAGAPGFCTRLAASTHLDGVPLAIGTLTADARNEDAVGQLEGAVADLEAVLDDVAEQDVPDELTARFEDLLASLYSATLNPVDDALRTRISERLAALGTQVQPVCEFPT